MKNCILSLLVFLQAPVSFGQGSLYSFSGNVSQLFYDGGGILAGQNVTVGDPVSVRYIVDFGAPGFTVSNDGTLDLHVDPPSGNIETAYFYCRLVSGAPLLEVNGGLNNRPQDVAEYFLGWNQSSPMGNEGLLWGGTGDSYFTVRKSGFTMESQVQEWHIGTEVRGVIVAFSDQDWSIAWADMRLDSITPVPEPSMPALICLGSVACLVWRRRGARQITLNPFTIDIRT